MTARAWESTVDPAQRDLAYHQCSKVGVWPGLVRLTVTGASEDYTVGRRKVHAMAGTLVQSGQPTNGAATSRPTMKNTCGEECMLLDKRKIAIGNLVNLVACWQRSESRLATAV
jgi:hypothetical protein